MVFRHSSLVSGQKFEQKMPLWLLIFIGFLIVSFLGLMGITYWQWRSVYHRERQKFADQTGLHVKRISIDSAAVLGFYRDHQVQIDHVWHNQFSRRKTWIRGAGRGKYLNIRLVVKNPSNLLFILEPHAMKWSGLVDWTQLETGSKKFDQHFYLMGSPENRVLKLFDSVSLKNGLLKEARRIYRGAVYLKLEKGLLTYEHYEQVSYSNASQLRFLIDLLSDLADEIDKPLI